MNVWPTVTGTAGPVNVNVVGACVASATGPARP